MTVHFKTILVAGLLLAGPLLAAAGCGGAGDRPELGQVVGTVTLDGNALAGATVTFQPKQGKSSRGLTDAQGHYELIYLRDIKGAAIGPHKVMITTATEGALQEKLPARYHRESELNKEVKVGPNTIDFPLTN
ncbi:MAG: carboxypeptidase-like regulatory domain-containing protein [Planctomycetota bacterium]